MEDSINNALAICPVEMPDSQNSFENFLQNPFFVSFESILSSFRVHLEYSEVAAFRELFLEALTSPLLTQFDQNETES